MKPEMDVEKCRAFIDSQLRHSTSPLRDQARPAPRPTVTISRETGAGAWTIASQLARFLEASPTRSPGEWVAFDRNLVERVLEDHHLPRRLAEFMVEDKARVVDDAVGELLGLHPSSWTLVQYTTETILRLAQMGHVILVGRASSVIANRLPNAFHVRLVGRIEERVRHTAEFYRMSEAEARQFVQEEDRRRQRYVRRYFDQEIQDPMLYHLVINTSRVPFEDATRLIGEAVIRHFALRG